MILTTLSAIVVCAGDSFAQTKKMPLGGYKTVSVEDEKVLEAADFAVATQSEKNETYIELTSIEKAESQVVAGVNYRICMKVTASADDETEEDAEEVTAFVKAIVFRNLKDEFSLTSWTVLETCGKK